MSSTSAATSSLPVVSPITLASNFSNSQAFIQSLFTGIDRSANVVFNNQSKPRKIGIDDKLTVSVYFGSFINQESIDTIVGAFYRAWTQKTQGPLQSSDFNLITALASYVEANCPLLWLPRIAFDKSLPVDGGDTGTPPIYYLDGYDPVPLMEKGAWNATGVELFLTLFLFGAHIVPMQQPLYGPAPPFEDFMTSMTAALGGSQFRGVDDSHYTDTVATTGEAYPSLIRGDQVPSNSPILCSFLMGPTVQKGSQRECFMQLEGWQSFESIASTSIAVIEYLILIAATGAAGLLALAIKLGLELSSTSWHMADYAIYGQTVWNFSTYGACAYSEKRGTTVFLSNPKWPAKMAPSSVMAPYLGANPAKKWLIKPLISASAFTEPNPMASVVSQPTGSASDPSTPKFMFDWSISQMPAGSNLRVAITDHPDSGNIAATLKVGNTNYALSDGAHVPASAVNSKDSYQLYNPQNAGSQSFVVTFFQQATGEG